MLFYIGNGAYLLNIPARDLSAEEVSQFGKEFLLATGLYATSAPSVLRTAHQNKESELVEKNKEKKS